MESFLWKIGEDAWEPEHLSVNHEADHGAADHRTGTWEHLHAQAQALILHGVVEGALTDHYFWLQTPVCQARIRPGDR